MLRSVPVLLLLAACGAPGVGSSTTQSQPDAITAAELPIKLDNKQLFAATFDQEIDHPYQPTPSLGTFKQRYWYTNQFASGPNAPVIFYFCGEDACDPWYATTMADAAMSLGASIVLLEHRYYGKSSPFPDKTLDHMKYLTIHNALEDAASFERFAVANLPLKGKWIAVGGSYPGMLAAFFRLTHPELVVGSWSSSAPVNTQLSFWGYDATIAQALGPTCTVLFQQVVAAASTAFDDPTALAQLSSTFGIDTTGWAKADFLDWVSGIAETDGQYGEEAGLCSALQQFSTNPMQGFILYLNPPLVPDPPSASTGVTGMTGATGSSNVAGASAAAPPSLPHFPILSRPDTTTDFTGEEWFYQVCTEVGFYQVHNPDRTQSVMSDLITESYWNTECQQYVTLTPDVVTTRARYYDPINRGEGSNMLFVNSSADPWSSLSFIDPSAAPAGVTVFVVQGGSHCQDLDNLTQDSLLGVFQAHKLFHDLATTWLSE